MAPRAPKAKLTDDTSSTPSPLKPKTEKSKIEKTTKSEKPKAQKIPKAKPNKALSTTAAGVDEDEDLEEVGGNVVKITKVKPVAKKGGAEKDGKRAVGEKDAKDGKEKVKSVTGDEAVDVMVKYLREQNRPYSATEISANLHGKVSKTVADKLLKEMEQNGFIMAKATNGTNKGSQWVFWAKQDPSDAASPEELSAMETSITTIRETLPALKNNLKILSTKLQTIRSAPTSSRLASIVGKLREENKMKDLKLQGFKNGSVKMVTKEEMEKVEREFKYWTSKRKGRMDAYQNLEALLLEGMTKDEIKEKVGVEEDTYGV